MTEPSSPALPARRSDRLAELRDEVAQVTVVHEIGVRRGRPDGAVAVAGLDGINVAFVRYGAEVTVDAFPTRNRFALTVPLGPMRVRAPGIADGSAPARRRRCGRSGWPGRTGCSSRTGTPRSPTSPTPAVSATWAGSPTTTATATASCPRRPPGVVVGDRSSDLGGIGGAAVSAR